MAFLKLTSVYILIPLIFLNLKYIYGSGTGTHNISELLSMSKKNFHLFNHTSNVTTDSLSTKSLEKNAGHLHKGILLMAAQPKQVEYPTTYKECLKVLQNFSYGVSGFTWCAVDHARPVQVCEECMDFYSDVEYYYNSIFTVKDGDKFCNEVLLNADKLQVVPTLYSEIQDLWNKANCDACYNITTDKGEKHYQLYDTVVQFNTYMHDVLDCINNATNETMAPFYSSKLEHTNVTNVCNSCKEAYEKMNQFYMSLLSDAGIDSICMDIVDVVNSTRSLWSNHYKCISEYNSTCALFVTMACVCLLPLIFYIAMRFAPKKQEINIVPRKQIIPYCPHYNTLHEQIGVI